MLTTRLTASSTRVLSSAQFKRGPSCWILSLYASPHASSPAVPCTKPWWPPKYILMGSKWTLKQWKENSAEVCAERKMSEQEEASRCPKILKRSVRHWARSPQTHKTDALYRTQHRGEPKSLPSTSLQQRPHAAIAARVSQGKTWRGLDLEVAAQRAEAVSPQRHNLLPTRRLRVKEEQEDRP